MTATIDGSPAGDSRRVRDQLRQLLLRTRTADGGWSYKPNHGSRLEPTCWALLALACTDDLAPDSTPIGRWSQHDGLLVDGPGLPPNNVANAIAALTLAVSRPSGGETSLIARLLVTRGDASGQFEELRQDNSLRAWSWISGTISWVEPTSWCLLVLKKARTNHPDEVLRERIWVGERFLVDRACAAGGWNYGNPNVYGTDLIPHVPTTAVALLAMQDRPSQPVVQRALAWLGANALRERSILGLGLSLLAMRAHAASVKDIEPALIRQAQTPLSDDAAADRLNIRDVAVALCALSDTAFSRRLFSLGTMRE